MQGNPGLTLTTDASTRGWGAVCGGRKTGGLWSLEEQTFHINYLEMKAVLLGLKSLCNKVTGKHVR
jgi:ribonuclease HI